MRIVLTVALAGTALVAAPYLSEQGPVTAALATIAVAVLLAGLASGAFTPLPIALGALGALAHAAVAPYSLAAAGALLVAFALGARALRARAGALQGLHVLGALASGGLAAWVAARYASAPVGVAAAAALVAGILASCSLVIPADDPIAFALLHLAAESPEPSRTTLLRAVFLRRRHGAAPEGLPERAVRSLERAWTTLVSTAGARTRQRATGARWVDDRIRAHVEALEKVYTAADERLARAAGLVDSTLDVARMEGEALEAEVSALAEVAAASVAPPPNAPDSADPTQQ